MEELLPKPAQTSKPDEGYERYTLNSPSVGSLTTVRPLFVQQCLGHGYTSCGFPVTDNGKSTKTGPLSTEAGLLLWTMLAGLSMFASYLLIKGKVKFLLFCFATWSEAPVKIK